MAKEIFKQFQKQFGKEWVCSCGSAFEAKWIEVVSQTNSSLLARYICQVCGREQIFSVSLGFQSDLQETPIIEIPTESINSDDVLEIRQETKGLSFNQIKSLAKKRVSRQLKVNKETTI